MALRGMDDVFRRLEPGGALVLQGQRIHRSDLYRYALDLRVENEGVADFVVGGVSV